MYLDLTGFYIMQHRLLSYKTIQYLIQSGSGWKSSMIVPIPKDGENSVPTNQYHCCLLFLKSWSITFTARSCYIYKLRTQLVINSGASVQKNPQSMHFSQLWTTGLNHLRQELTLELFSLTSLKPLTQCHIGHCSKKRTSVGFNKCLIKWVASYLTGRKQQVVVNGPCSNFSPLRGLC